MDKIQIIPKLDPSVVESLEVQWSKVVLSINEDKCTYLFTIVNFSNQIKAVGEVTYSPPFTFEKNKSMQWKLDIRLGGVSEESKEYIGLFLHNLSENEVTVDYSLAILDFKGKKVFSNNTRQKLFRRNGQLEAGWGYNKFIKREDLIKSKDKLLPGGNLTIICSISFNGHAAETFASGTIQKESIEGDFAQKMNLLQKMYYEDRFKDFKVIIGNKNIKLHKNVLASASSVFKAMLTHDSMKEAKDNFVEINDACYEIVNEMVKFIYTGKVKDLPNIAQELLVVADKYDVQDLKTLCEQSLCRSLNVSNVAQRLAFADLYKTERLKAASMIFISNHKDDLVGMPEYEEIAKKHSYLILQAFSLTKPVETFNNVTEG